MEVHRPRHAGGRQLRHEHRRRDLRRRHQRPRHEDRRRGALSCVPRQGEVVRRQRGAQGSGRRAGDRDSGASRRQAGGVPRPRRRRGDRHQHLVGDGGARQARHRVGWRPQRQARLEHVQRRAHGLGPRRRPRRSRSGQRRRGAGLGRAGARGRVLCALLHPHADGATGRLGRRHPDAGQGRDLDPGAQLGPAVRGGGVGHRADRCRV